MKLDFNDPKHLKELEDFKKIRDIMNEAIQAYEDRNEEKYLASAMRLMLISKGE